ncbi:MAG TPA: hypothetical protein DD635_01320 [Flavobacteriales bacterium]|nr:hypothetical protein [Flavobacteriales bacterium]
MYATACTLVLCPAEKYSTSNELNPIPIPHSKAIQGDTPKARARMYPPSIANQNTEIPLEPASKLINRLHWLTTSKAGLEALIWVVGIPPNIEFVQSMCFPNKALASLASLLMPTQF